MKKRVEITVLGIVQGVSYRYYTIEQAQKINLLGIVRNESDGCVKIIAEGEVDDLKKLINWCNEGPRSAKVDKVNVQWQDAVGEYSDFSIKY